MPFDPSTRSGPSRAQPRDDSAQGRPPLLDVRHLVKEFSRREGFFTRPSIVRAVNDVSFTVDEGETFGLVGESGSGKTTTSCILRLIDPTSGEVLFRGESVLGLRAKRCSGRAGRCKSCFRIPYSSLNPRIRARHIIEEPLVIHKIGNAESRMERVKDLFRLVGLDAATINRYPHEFSGGQRQRIGVARVFALNPSYHRGRTGVCA